MQLARSFSRSFEGEGPKVIVVLKNLRRKPVDKLTSPTMPLDAVLRPLEGSLPAGATRHMGEECKTSRTNPMVIWVI
jgi:hypothetical protein